MKLQYLVKSWVMQSPAKKLKIRPFESEPFEKKESAERFTAHTKDFRRNFENFGATLKEVIHCFFATRGVLEKKRSFWKFHEI